MPSPRTLQRGDRGEDVRALQVWLSTHWRANLVADGILGALTEAALKRFQAASGLDPDGVVGPETRTEVERQTADYLGRLDQAGGW